MCCRPLLLQGVPWPSPDCPVLFINVDGKEQRTATSGVRRGGEQSEQSSDSEDGSGGGDDGSAAEGGASYCNPAEADVAIRALQRLIERDPDLQSVALLSPYRCAAGMGGSPGLACHCREARRQAVHARVACGCALRCPAVGFCPSHAHPQLTRLCCSSSPPPRSGQVRLLSSMVTKANVPEELLQRCSLAVSTVDGYQGREADAVIFSAVRW